MYKPTQIAALVTMTILTLTLIGCAAVPPSVTPPAEANQSPAAATSQPTQPPSQPTAAVPGSPVVSTPAGVATSAGEPVPATGLGAPQPSQAPTGASGLVITRANNGQTVTMHVRDRFVLTLGEEYQWSLSISDQSVLHRVINIMPLRGSQGVFEALAPGSADLTAAGDPPCRQSTPPCAMPSVSFELKVNVVP
jgi:hypothetical protein